MGRIDQIARDCIEDIGYEQKKFPSPNCRSNKFIHEQSAHIKQGVDASKNKAEGAGDQGIMFGYATDETEDLMPAYSIFYMQFGSSELEKMGLSQL